MIVRENQNNSIDYVINLSEHWHYNFQILICVFNWICLVGTVLFMAAPSRQQLQEYHHTEVTLEEDCCSTRDMTIDNNFKSQLKNGTLYTSKSFLLILIAQYISTCSKLFELLPTSSISMHRVKAPICR